MQIYLEMLGEEIVLSPGHKIELLAEPVDGLLPLAFYYSDKGLQIYPHKADPDRNVRFKWKLIRPGYPTILSEYE
jgi:hypothetical protein